MKKRKWYHPELSDTGWDKDLPPETRRSLMLKAHGGDVTASARALQALANVTENPEPVRKPPRTLDISIR